MSNLNRSCITKQHFVAYYSSVVQFIVNHTFILWAGPDWMAGDGWLWQASLISVNFKLAAFNKNRRFWATIRYEQEKKTAVDKTDNKNKQHRVFCLLAHSNLVTAVVADSIRYGRYLFVSMCPDCSAAATKHNSRDRLWWAAWSSEWVS